MKKDHKKWADLVIKGVNEVEAYLSVYPNASKKTAFFLLDHAFSNCYLWCDATKYVSTTHDYTYAADYKVPSITSIPESDSLAYYYSVVIFCPSFVVASAVSTGRHMVCPAVPNFCTATDPHIPL